MATPTNVPVTENTPITIKISINGSHKKLKLPLKDLGASVLPDKLRHLLGIAPEQEVVFERFSDSAGGYVVLDPHNPAVYKTLVRAAKAKLKLRLKATVEPSEAQLNQAQEQEEKQTLEPSKMPETATPDQDVPVARSPPASLIAPRDSTAVDRRSVGSGIFEYRESRASSSKAETASNEAPVPSPFTLPNNDVLSTPLAVRTRPVMVSGNTPWSVYCNVCDVVMSNAHFHCNICDKGDFDICEQCVEKGFFCPGEDHWLIKRFVSNGRIIDSTADERISQRPKKDNFIKKEVVRRFRVYKEMPGAFTEDSKLAREGSVPEKKFEEPSRTCNSCVVVMPEHEFVTCTVCEDFDLCRRCHTDNKHGHHPAHSFKPATEQTELSLMEKSLLPAGRNVRHHAICDGCDRSIYGVRYKCFNCPDFDYCGGCIAMARSYHPRHRFAALYEPIPGGRTTVVRHHGVYCDGPLCKGKDRQTAIEGVRYKCVVCHDTDFCANCEALPGHHHNKTHPLIMFKTPVNNLTISTEHEQPNGTVRMVGDRCAAPALAAKALVAENPATKTSSTIAPVRTVADIKPTVEAKAPTPPPAYSFDSIIAADPAIKKLESHFSTLLPVSKVEDAPKEATPTAALDAHFVCDTIRDGTVVAPNTRFTQVWTIKNPGPHAWPAGCSVRYVGGDNMLNVDNRHAASVTDINEATESNVVGREVNVGEEVAFKVVMKAPERLGKAISYWRLKAADGTPFGHRLWCDVDVKKDEHAISTSQQVNAMSWAREHVRPQHEALLQQKLQLESRQKEREAALLRAKEQWTAAVRARTLLPSEQASTYFKQFQDRLNAMQAAQAERLEAMGAQQSARVQAQQGQRLANAQRLDDLMKLHAAITSSAQPQAPAEPSGAPVPKTEEASAESAQTATEHIPELAKGEIVETSEEPKEEMQGSQMVFPTLEKESPISSAYQSMTSSSTRKGKAAYVEDEETGVKIAEASNNSSTEPEASDKASVAESEAVTATEDVTEEGFETVSDDLEVLSADGEAEDDGFMTDEEYDILDASDRETVSSRN